MMRLKKLIPVLLCSLLVCVLLCGCGGTVPEGKMCTVTFDSNGAFPVYSISVPFASKLSPPTMTREGYDFGGWMFGDRLWNFDENSVTEDLTLTAKWTPTTNWTWGSFDYTIAYMITYDLNGGTNAQSNPSAYNVETETFTLAEPTKAGYVFTGWTYEGQTVPRKTVTVSKGSTGNKTFTANWENPFILSADGKTLTDLTSLGKSAMSLEIPSGVMIIGDQAFSGCSGLTSITIPDSVMIIGDYAFYNCRWLKSVTIGKNVTSIGNNAFKDCNELTSVHIKDLTKWCGIAFGNNSANPLYYAHNLYLNGNLITDLVIPDSVTSIGYSAFYYCSGLTNVTIGKNVTSIGSYAFCDCTGLTSVTIPDSVTSIGYSAFYDCTGLTSVTIGKNVTSIGDYAFDGCKKLIEVCNLSKLTIKEGQGWSYGYVGFYAKHVITDPKDSCLTTSNGYIFYEDGTDSYLMGYTGTDTELTLPTTSPSGKNYSVHQYAFYGCSGLTSITIPDNVTSIGDAAFACCFGLTSITIGKNVTSIGSYAFYYCSGLTSITIPDSVTGIGNYAFYYCSGLTSVTIGKNVTSIGENAFKDCSKLMSAMFVQPDGWTVGTTNLTGLSDTSIAAFYLRSTYCGYDWKRN